MGWAMSSSELASGSRQISRLHFPGDVLGLESLGVVETSDTLTAVSDVIVASFNKVAAW
jgi:CRP-like cAMP-binding protein